MEEKNILHMSNAELLGWYNFTKDQAIFYQDIAKAERHADNIIGAIEMEQNAFEMREKKAAFNAVLLGRLKDVSFLK